MNDLVKRSLSSFTKSPLRAFADTDFSLFDNFLDGMFDDFKSTLPYNTIVKDQNNSVIEVAMAGFSKDEIAVELLGEILTIKSQQKVESPGVTADNSETEYPYYLHRGIAKRSFKAQFKIGKNYEVGDVTLVDGLLRVNLKRNAPEVEKPKLLKIK